MSFAHVKIEGDPNGAPMMQPVGHSNPYFNIAPYIRQGLSTDDIVINWLKETFETSPQHTLCREVLFEAYTKFVKDFLGTQPMNSASLGKLLRTVFPHISTRRLGARGQSKYHYNGLRFKQPSAPSQEAALLVPIGPATTTTTWTSSYVPPAAEDPYASAAVAVPTIPSVQDLVVTTNPPPQGPVTDIPELVSRYQSYMQRISNMIYNNQLNDVKESVNEFWAIISSPYQPLLESPDLIHQIEVYDTLFYSSVLNSIESVLLEEVHYQLKSDLRNLANNFGTWISDATAGKIPDVLRESVLKGTKLFALAIRHRLVINEFAMAAQRFMKMPFNSNIDVAMLYDNTHGRWAGSSQFYVNLLELCGRNANLSECVAFIYTSLNDFISQMPARNETQFLSACLDFLTLVNSLMTNLGQCASQLAEVSRSLRGFFIAYVVLLMEKQFVNQFGYLIYYGMLAGYVNAAMIVDLSSKWQEASPQEYGFIHDLLYSQ